eukprot:3699678-Pleurochrysis_carterae.AAC.1
MQIHATLAARRRALSPSRSPAPCAVPHLTARRLALFRRSPPGALRCLTFRHPPAPRAISHRGSALRFPPLAA